MFFPKQVSVVLTLVLTVFSIPIEANEFGEVSFVPLSGQPHDVVFDKLRGLAYVSNRTLDQVAIIDMATLTVTSSSAVGETPTGLAITPDGSQLLVTTYGSTGLT